MKTIIEMQLQAQFLRIESTGGQTGTKLVEHVCQKKRQRLEQDQRMIQFHGLFKNQRRFHRNQRARNRSPRELLQLDARLPKPLAERDFGQRAQRAKITYAPQVKSFQKSRSFFRRLRRREFREQNIQRQIPHALRFLAFRNHGHSRKAARRKARRVGIARGCHIRFEPKIGGPASNVARDFRQRAEQRLKPGKIQNHRVGRSVFHPGRKRLRTIEQGRMGCSLLQCRARAQHNFRERIELNFRHARLDARAASLFVYSKNFLQWRFAFEHRNRLRPQLRLRPHNGFGRKVRDENAGERHGENQFSVFSSQFSVLVPYIWEKTRLQSDQKSPKIMAALATKKRSLHTVHTVFVAKALMDCTALHSFRERTTSS